MIAVLLDASCLRQEGLVSTAMIALTRLAENGRVVVLLSDIAVREDLSQQDDDFSKQLDEARVHLSNAIRKLRIPDPPVRELERLSGEIEVVNGALQGCYKAAFDEWADRCGARRITFDLARFDDVVDDYFSGVGAFRGPKFRNDFPDALILSSAQSVASDYEQLHMVTADKNLRSAAEGFGFIGHKELNDFLQSETVRRLKDQLDVELKTVEIATKLSAPEYLDKIVEWMRGDNSQLEFVHLEQGDILGLEAIGATVVNASIGFPIPRDITTVIVSLTTPSEADKWSIAIEFETQCKLHLVTLWPDFIALEGKRAFSFESADDVVELTEAWWADFYAEIVLDLCQFKQGSSGELPSVDALSPELKIYRATLIRPAHQ